MANVLKMAKIEAIRRLRALKWSARRIALELGIDRGTVGRYLKLSQNEPKPAIVPAGSGDSKPATFPGLPGRASEETEDAELAEIGGNSNPAIVPAGSEGESDAAGGRLRRGRRSHCEPYHEIIRAKLDQGLSAQRIFQGLASEHGFAHGYDSVKRYARRLSGPTLPMRRMECAAGEEVQVDFGTGAPILTPDGKRRKTWVFRVVLNATHLSFIEL